MRDKSSTELFQIVKNALHSNELIGGVALSELEDRWFSGRTEHGVLARLARLEENSHRPVDFGPMLARLARVEKDLAAFKRAHAEHVHTWSPDFFTTGYARKVEDRPDLLPSLSLLEPPRYR